MLNLRIFFTLTLTALISCCASAAIPDNLDGTLSPYPQANNDTRIDIPDSLTTVFINHVGRHGSRYLTSMRKLNPLYEALKGERLTKEGKRFMELLRYVERYSTNRWGDLDSLGMAEEAGIARAMAYRFLTEESTEGKEEHRSGRFNAFSSYVPRSIMSMYSFCHELARFSHNNSVATSEGKQYSYLMWYFVTDKSYRAYLDSGAWKQPYTDFIYRTVSPAPFLRLIKDGEKRIDTRKAQDLSFAMYEVVSSLAAAGKPRTAESYFSEAEYRSCWKVGNLRRYLQRTHNRFSSAAATAAIPLLENIIATTDSVLPLTTRPDSAEALPAQTDSATAPLLGQLRFGHAETLLPLYSLMNLPGCNYPDLEIDQVSDFWHDYQITPLAANIQIIYLRSTSGRIYTLTLINSEPTDPLGNGEKFVEWGKLRSYWLARIEQFSIK